MQEPVGRAEGPNEHITLLADGDDDTPPLPPDKADPHQSLPDKPTIQKEQHALRTYRSYMQMITALSELACANNGCPGSYDWLNGHQFFGREYIQFTWSYNYRAASLDLNRDANVLLNDPESVATDQNKAWNVSFWYWKANVHNAPGVQDGQFGSSTKAINGNLECSAPGNPAALARYAIYQRLFTIFGIGGSPNPAGCA
ncbi:hypothetical protein EMCRGX_G001361 [Ephydatia muelleri]